ncbi:MAG: hypothetical protein ACE5I7_15065 [Candidatus Binatia bacterium]
MPEQKGSTSSRGVLRRSPRLFTATGQFGGVECVRDRRPPIADERFVDDDPSHSVIRDQRLEQVLVNNDMRWVVELPKLLAGLDY